MENLEDRWECGVCSYSTTKYKRYVEHNKTHYELSVSNSQRWRFVSDNDGHHYLIPADLINTFHTWVMFSEDAYYTGQDFNEYRINCHESFYTFTDPKED